MKKSRFFSLVLLLILGGLFAQSPFGQGAYAQGVRQVDVLKVKGVINPIVSQYVNRGIERAENEGVECLIIELNTPGGLDKSMRTIIERMLSAKVPVVVYVSPPGARAASAGAFIGIASDILAMAESTNIGAAHPVDLGGKITKTMSEKITSDAAAYIRSIAVKRGRNAVWAEKAVRKSLSLSGEEAVKQKVADLSANNLEDLLNKLDGKKVKGSYGIKVLKTKGAKVKEIKMTFQERLLHDISDPNVAYILMMLAIYGLIYELANPGAIFPGVVGGICLILAFFALESLPVNLAGIFLILLGIGLFIGELKTPGIGVFAVGAVISLFLGSLMLFSSSGPYLNISVSLSLIIAFVTFTTFFFLFAVSMGIKALKSKVTSGTEGMVGRKGIAKTNLSPDGMILVEGEDWSAQAEEGEIKIGEEVEVIGVEGLKLKVKKRQKVGSEEGKKSP